MYIVVMFLFIDLLHGIAPQAKDNQVPARSTIISALKKLRWSLSWLLHSPFIRYLLYCDLYWHNEADPIDSWFCYCDCRYNRTRRFVAGTLNGDGS